VELPRELQCAPVSAVAAEVVVEDEDVHGFGPARPERGQSGAAATAWQEVAWREGGKGAAGRVAPSALTGNSLRERLAISLRVVEMAGRGISRRGWG
jgi:hypothetical protein